MEYGQTALSRFAARFPDSVASSWQGVGVLSITDELSFGMNRLEFGIWHRYGGEVEVRTFQITTAATTGENATVTINGTAYVVALTGGGTVQDDAREVAAYLSANATGFAAEQLNDSVIVSALSDSPKSDTWSYSSASSVASITRTTTGVTKTSDFTAQADFNGDVADDFDSTKGNVYEITYGAGYSNADFRIYDVVQKRFVVAHEIKNANQTSRLLLNNPALRSGMYSASMGSTTDIACYCSFMSLFAQGMRTSVRNPRAFSNSKAVTTTLVNLLTIRTKRIYNGLINQSEIEPLTLTISNEGNKSLIVELRANATVAGPTNFQNIGTNLISETEISGTNVTQNGRLLTVFTVAPSDNQIIDLKKLEIQLPPTLSLVVAVKQLTGGSSSTVVGTLVWREDL